MKPGDKVRVEKVIFNSVTGNPILNHKNEPFVYDFGIAIFMGNYSKKYNGKTIRGRKVKWGNGMETHFESSSKARLTGVK